MLLLLLLLLLFLLLLLLLVALDDSISSLRASILQVKQVWLADDSAGGGSIESLYQWYESLCEEGRKIRLYRQWC